MPPFPHQIGRQCWRARVPSPAQAFAFRCQLRDLVETELPSCFEQVFDALRLGERVLRIPQLTVQLRLRVDPSAADIKAALVQSLTEEMRRWERRHFANHEGG